jgi:hypothetical protein
MSKHTEFAVLTVVVYKVSRKYVKTYSDIELERNILDEPGPGGISLISTSKILT